MEIESGNMFESLRSLGRPLRLAKTDSAFTTLLVCLLLSAPSLSFARSDLAGRRDTFSSFVGLQARKDLPLTQGNAEGTANKQCHQQESPPDRFPYLCSLRVFGSRDEGCRATAVGDRWLMTAAHCIDPKVKESVGCYPIVYCGDDEADTVSKDDPFFVENAYIHHDWDGEPSEGSDIAMLKLDRPVNVTVPQLIRNGMVYDPTTDMVVPDWIAGSDADTCGHKSHKPICWQPQDKSPQQVEDVPDDSWLYICDENKNDDMTGPFSMNEGPLLVPDTLCDNICKGYPSTDVVLGVKSFDVPEEECAVYSNVAYYNDWIKGTMNDETPPAKCKTPEELSPQSQCTTCKSCEKPESSIPVTSLSLETTPESPVLSFLNSLVCSPSEPREPCVNDEIGEEECIRKDCCWTAPNKGSDEPWCYKRNFPTPATTHATNLDQPAVV